MFKQISSTEVKIRSPTIRYPIHPFFRLAYWTRPLLRRRRGRWWKSPSFPAATWWTVSGTAAPSMACQTGFGNSTRFEWHKLPYCAVLQICIQLNPDLAKNLNPDPSYFLTLSVSENNRYKIKFIIIPFNHQKKSMERHNVVKCKIILSFFKPLDPVSANSIPEWADLPYCFKHWF